MELEPRVADAFARLEAMEIAVEIAEEEGSRAYTGESRSFVIELSVDPGPELDLRVGVADGTRYWFAWSKDSDCYGVDAVLDDLDAFVTALMAGRVLVGRRGRKIVFTFPTSDGYVVSRRGWSKITSQSSSPTARKTDGLVSLLDWTG